MEEFLKQLNLEMKKVLSQAYYELNTADPVVFPYLVYDFDSEGIEYSQDGFYIDVDIVDNSGGYLNIIRLEEALKKHFFVLRILTPELFTRYRFLRSTKVPTGDERIKQRNLQFYCKVDWRKE